LFFFVTSFHYCSFWEVVLPYLFSLFSHSLCWCYLSSLDKTKRVFFIDSFHLWLSVCMFYHWMPNCPIYD